MGKQSKPINKYFWHFCFTLTTLVLLSACGDDGEQPLPTQLPVAEVDIVGEEVMAETAVSIPLVATYTPEPIEVIVNSNQTVMTLWHSWTDNNAEALAQLVAGYETDNPNMKITLVYQANLGDALKTAVPVGEGPDLILMPQDQLGNFAESGWVAPITANFDAGYLAENFSDAATSAMIWQDNVWGIPALQDGIAIIYNKSLIDGNLIPKDSTDFDTLLNNAIAYHETNPDKYLLCNQSLSADSLDVYHTAPIFFGFGGNEEAGYVDDGGNVFINTPEKVAAGEWLLSFIEAAPAETGYEICQAGFLAGEFASWWTGSWSVDTLQESGIDYGVGAFGRPFSHITGLFLSTNAQERGHQEAATEFMTYIASPAVQTDLALAVNIAPANRLALASEAIQAQPDLAAFGEAAANGIPFSSSPYADAQWEPIGRATSNILSRVQTPEEALTEAQTAVEQAIQNTK